jgi:hypothetical protein
MGVSNKLTFNNRYTHGDGNLIFVETKNIVKIRQILSSGALISIEFEFS